MTSATMRSISICAALSPCAACATVHADLDAAQLALSTGDAPRWSAPSVSADATPLVWIADPRAAEISIPLPFDSALEPIEDDTIVLLQPGEDVVDALALRRARGRSPQRAQHDHPIFLPGTFVDVTRLTEDRQYWDDLANGIAIDLFSGSDGDRRSRVSTCFGPGWTPDGLVVLGLQISF